MPVNHWLFDGCAECGARIGPNSLYTFHGKDRERKPYCEKCHQLDGLVYDEKKDNYA